MRVNAQPVCLLMGFLSFYRARSTSRAETRASNPGLINLSRDPDELSGAAAAAGDEGANKKEE